MPSRSPTLSCKTFSHLLAWSIVLILFVMLTGVLVVAFPQHGHLVVLMLAIGFLVHGFRQWRYYHSLKHWLPTAAHITHLEEKIAQQAIHGGVREFVYPHMVFSYDIADQTYQSKTVSPHIKNVWVPVVDGWGSATPLNQRWWRALSVGQSGQVFVHPDRHDWAFFTVECRAKVRSHIHALMMSGVFLLCVWYGLVRIT